MVLYLQDWMVQICFSNVQNLLWSFANLQMRLTNNVCESNVNGLHRTGLPVLALPVVIDLMCLDSTGQDTSGEDSPDIPRHFWAGCPDMPGYF